MGELSLRIAGAAACLLLVSSGSGAAAGFPGIARVRALPDSLAVELTGRSPSARLVELRPYETVASQRQGAAVWAGPVNGQTVRLPRFADGRDRLYSRFQLVSDKTLRAIGPPCWVTDLEALPAWRFPMPWPASKKGVTCPVDMDDLHALGARYADWGVVLAGIFDWTGGPPKETWEVDGQHLPINVHYIAWLDGLVRRATELGVNVTLIPINGVPDHADAGNPLIHPRTDPAAAPNHIGAFNLTGERGLRYYRAAFEYLARRYSDPSGEHGWVSGYVVGNELQSHWAWHHMGRASREEVTREYADQLRIAWLAVRRFHKSVRVYASMDHTWASRLEPDPMKGMPGDWFLERLNRTIAREGNFPWDVAFHPYPEDLFEPRFWNDQTAVMGFDSPRITFRNLEVLPAFLSQQRFLYRGRPRRIILSEQGFHCPDGPDGEAVQAAARAEGREVPEGLKTVTAFTFNLFGKDSRTWQIDLINLGDPPVEIRPDTDFAYVKIDAITGELLDVTFPDTESREAAPVSYGVDPEGPWSAMGPDMRPLAFGHKAAPRAFWDWMAEHYGDRGTVERAIVEWIENYGEDSNFWPLQAKAVTHLWLYMPETTPEELAQAIILGLPQPEHLTQEQAEARAWELLKEAGKEVYTQEDYEAVRLKTGFFYGAIYPNGCAWQIEFADERHDYDTYIGDVTLDGLTGKPLTVSAEPSNG